MEIKSYRTYRNTFCDFYLQTTQNSSVGSEEPLQDYLIWDDFLFANVIYLHWVTSEIPLQPHLPSVSDNINEVEFHSKDYDRILAVISREGEKILVNLYISFSRNVINRDSILFFKY